MTKLTPYLFFSGNCIDAMKFYQQIFGGKLEIMRYGDHDESCEAAVKEQVMHACLAKDGFNLMASDSPMMEVTRGTNVQIAIDCGSLAEIETTFKGLADGGHVIAELHDAFWGDRFGCLTDRFGVQWMLTCPLQR